MPYPTEPPTAKNDLVLPDAMVAEINTSSSLLNSNWAFASTAKIFEALQAPSKQHGELKALATLYSYSDAPTVPAPLSRALIVIGVADTALSIVRKLLPDDAPPADCIHKCTLGVKRADAKFVAQLNPRDVRNSQRFASFMKQLQKDSAVAIVAPDKKQRFGIIKPMHDATETDIETDYHQADDFAANFFVGKVDEIKSFLVRPASEEVGLGIVDTHDPEPSTDLWAPPSTETSDDTGFGNTNVDFNVWVQPPQSSSAEANGAGRKRKRSDEHTETNNFHSDAGAAAADNFYSNLPRSLKTRADSKLYHMRAFNNWLKATQIQELDPITRQSGNHGARGPLRVLDLACGKGGDLGKWALHSRGIGNYVGIDVARGSLRDAAKRARGMRRKLRRCTFTCADLGADVPGVLRSPNHKQMQKLPTWVLQDESEYEVGDPEFTMMRGGGINSTDKFDVVSIQFAIHYMMSSKKRARRFFQTVSQLLEVGGNLIATTIDARVAVEGLMNLGLNLHCDSVENSDEDRREASVVSVGSGACRIRFEPDTVKTLFHCLDKDQTGDDMFGLQYTFTLVEGSDHEAGFGDAVNLPEWLTPVPVLKSLASEAGLELVSVENFHEFYANRRDADVYNNHAAAHTALYNMHVLNRNGSLSEDEWEIIRLYAALKFHKVRESTIELDDEEPDAEEDAEEQSAEQQVEKCSPPDSGSVDPEPPSVKSTMLLPMAIKQAKNATGSERWEALSSGEKKRLIQIQLNAMST